MSFQYDQYLANHRANVKRGFDWLCENLSDVTIFQMQLGRLNLLMISLKMKRTSIMHTMHIFMETTGLIKSSRIIKKHG